MPNQIDVKCLHCDFTGITNKVGRKDKLIDYGVCPNCNKIGSLTEKSVDDKNRKKV